MSPVSENSLSKFKPIQRLLALTVFLLSACASHEPYRAEEETSSDLQSVELSIPAKPEGDLYLAEPPTELIPAAIPLTTDSHSPDSYDPKDDHPKNIDFWKVMLDGFAVPPLVMPSVTNLDRLYANNPDFLTRSLQRSAPYMHEIIVSLNQRGMPTDLALLPVIESGFDPGAISPASAAGIWQFIPATGRRFGLKQDWLRDERRDPLAATNAALDYLQALHRLFGDWHLALAAYNCGESCVARAIQKSRSMNGSLDFSGIERFLPQETRDYVPRFMAVRNVFRNFHASRVRLPHIHHHSRIASIMVNQVVDLRSVARLAGVSYEELAVLNAGVLRQAVPSSNSLIWLPETALAKLKESIAGLSKKKEAILLMNLRPVKAKPGESLQAFAARQLVTVEQLRSINNIPAALHYIQSGTLFVPRQADEALFQGDISAMAPLRMAGEEKLLRARAAKNNKLLASHPQLAKNSGWIPGRLRLVGGRFKTRK